MISFLCAAACGFSHAQIEVDKPLHLARVEGYVVNSAGKPLAHAEVTLDQEGTVIYRTRTNDAGAFRFDHVLGHYWFRVARTEYAPAAREIGVGDLIESYLERKKLYVIVGPGACADACSSVFTSKHEFEKAIREKNRH
ncbi:MAG TPA: carboxypeptidase-like regulatory domain-containing protein [Terracidiphilus sp.]|nr:carboxypeptidase-like regulatory domain-containing protein [Terracidiphilus sp.]